MGAAEEGPGDGGLAMGGVMEEGGDAGDGGMDEGDGETGAGGGVWAAARTTTSSFWLALQPASLPLMK